MFSKLKKKLVIGSERKLWAFLLVSNVYCLILGGFNGGDKVAYPLPYFLNFLAWWCVGNSCLTIAFLLGRRIKKPSPNSYFTQIVSLITMISNLITILIYGLGLIVGLITGLTTVAGVTARSIKGVPIPSHRIIGKAGLDTSQLGKVIHGGIYSPLGHLIAPAYFMAGFFRFSSVNLLKKKLKLTIAFCLVMPSLYFTYCWLRTKVYPKSYLQEPFVRWPFPFLSSKNMSNNLSLAPNYRFVGKIILFIVGGSLFSSIAYVSLRLAKNYRAKKKKKHCHLFPTRISNSKKINN